MDQKDLITFVSLSEKLIRMGANACYNVFHNDVFYKNVFFNFIDFLSVWRMCEITDSVHFS